MNHLQSSWGPRKRLAYTLASAALVGGVAWSLAAFREQRWIARANDLQARRLVAAETDLQQALLAPEREIPRDFAGDAFEGFRSIPLSDEQCQSLNNRSSNYRLHAGHLVLFLRRDASCFEKEIEVDGMRRIELSGHFALPVLVSQPVHLEGADSPLPLVVCLSLLAAVIAFFASARRAAPRAPSTSSSSDQRTDDHGAQLDVLREAAKRVAHELKNPLMPIRTTVETLKRAHARKHERFDALFDEGSATILTELDRIELFLKDYSDFAELPPPKPRWLDLKPIVVEVANMHSPKNAAGETLTDAGTDISVRAEVEDGLPQVSLDPSQLRQTLLNLIKNAIESCQQARAGGQDSGRVRVSAYLDTSRVVLFVEDDGLGWPEQALQTHFTSKELGSGLGLSMVRRFALAHGAQLSQKNSEWGGARAEIRFASRHES